jgi:RNA polymerase sigma-54 factor
VKQTQTLQLKLSQHLTLTPQLQQSIRLLQLSTVELNAEVERLLQENPLLEKAEGDDDGPPAGIPSVGSTLNAPPDAPAQPGERADDGAHERGDAVERADFEDYSSGDPDWGGGAAPDDDDDGFYPQQVATSTLRDHLLSQLAVLNLALRDRQIVAALIDALDEDGYLHASLEEIAELFPKSHDRSDELSIALRYVQSFEPAGIARATPPNAWRCS